ncbi:MAG: ChaN family lipoprotein [Vulcanimicrobiota bacterium]
MNAPTRVALLLLFVLLQSHPGLCEDDTFADLVSSKRVVFLGERHDFEDDHAGQLAALRQLKGLDQRPLLLAVEMFDECDW